jgi:hypothetical protein
MRPTIFRNRISGERVVCNDPKKDTKVIDGVDYYLVHFTHSTRQFLMRKEALERIKE